MYLFLLDHRNTPTEQTGLFPAQRLFCRRTRTLLPMSTKLLQPETQPTIKDKLLLSQDKQASYYNKVSRLLPIIQPGDVVRFKLPGKDTWTKHYIKVRLHQGLAQLNVMVKLIDVIANISDTRAHQKHWNQPLELKLIVIIVFLWRSNQ